MTKVHRSRCYTASRCSRSTDSRSARCEMRHVRCRHDDADHDHHVAGSEPDRSRAGFSGPGVWGRSRPHREQARIQEQFAPIGRPRRCRCRGDSLPAARSREPLGRRPCELGAIDPRRFAFGRPGRHRTWERSSSSCGCTNVIGAGVDIEWNFSTPSMSWGRAFRRRCLNTDVVTFEFGRWLQKG
ncbi:Hypothetical protein A7982_06241 [Minicystis rosea]|nr:Hypothetical protein A7982_06241 [Minicystis rosea]